MATQHPDNAGIPFWHNQAFISTQDEIIEIFENFSTLGVDEYMWDWEGKFADEAILEKIFNRYLEFFQKKQIGKDVFITLRVPNIWTEKTFKLARSYVSVISASEFTKSLNLHSPPVFEVILPMTKSADQLIHIQETFRKTADLHEQIFGNNEDTKKTPFTNGYINIIPLFESIDDLADCANILTDYIKLHLAHYKTKPKYLRAFIARSDPALNAGFIPSVIASRLALREFYRVSEEHDFPIYPIIGTGSLPFRGGVNPENIEEVLKLYEGAKTFTIQSAFRYDYPQEEVKKAIQKINKHVKTCKPLKFTQKEFDTLRTINNTFRDLYCPTIESAATHINELAAVVPRRRERVQHIGLFGYNRGIGKTKLPRAIPFTSAWYSMGIPPEFIGTGRGLKKIKAQGLLPHLEKHFPGMRQELIHAGKYLNLENLENFSKKFKWAKEILEDIKLCTQILKIDLGPQKDHHFIHRNLTSTILLKKNLGQDYSAELLEAAMLRKSLG